MEWRWGSEEENRKEKSGDDVEGSKDGPRESQEGGNSVICLLLVYWFCFI